MFAHRRVTSLLSAAVLVGVLSSQSFATTLDFDVPVPGTINDANGLGTGFTHRLPGTGAALPANDPNMELLTAPGRLLHMGNVG